MIAMLRCALIFVAAGCLLQRASAAAVPAPARDAVGTRSCSIAAPTTMKRNTPAPDPTHAAIAAFLEAHYAHAHSNDVGPLLGRLAALCDEHREETISPQQWNAAISLALTGHAPRGLH